MAPGPTTLFDILGQPDRTTGLANTISTWDDLGVTAYFDNTKGELGTLGIIWSPGQYELSPKRGYPGTLVLNGIEVTSETTIAQVNDAAKGQKFAKVFNDVQWQKCEYKSTTDHVDLTAPSGGGGLALKALSISPPKH